MDGAAPPALLRRRRRGAALRPGRRPAAHGPAAAVAADPPARGRARRAAAAPHDAPRRPDRRRGGLPGPRPQILARGRRRRRARRSGSPPGCEGRLVVGCVGSATYSPAPAPWPGRCASELPGVDFGFRGEMLSPDQVGALLRRLDRPRRCCGRRSTDGTRPDVARPAPRPATSSRCPRVTASRRARGSGSRTCATRASSCTPAAAARRCTTLVAALCRRGGFRAEGPARGGGDLDAGDLRGGRARGGGRPRAGGRAGRRRGDVPPAGRRGPDGPAGRDAGATTTPPRSPARWPCSAPSTAARPAGSGRPQARRTRCVMPGAPAGDSPRRSAPPRHRARPRC